MLFKWFGWCWPHRWRYHSRRRDGFRDDYDNVLGHYRYVCRRCEKRHHKMDPYPPPTLQTILRSRGHNI